MKGILKRLGIILAVLLPWGGFGYLLTWLASNKEPLTNLETFQIGYLGGFALMLSMYLSIGLTTGLVLWIVRGDN